MTATRNLHQLFALRARRDETCQQREEEQEQPGAENFHGGIFGMRNWIPHPPLRQPRLQILPHHVVSRSPLWPLALIYCGALHSATPDGDRPRHARGAAHNQGPI